MDAQWPGGIAEPHSAGCRADHDRPVDHIDVEIAAGGARLKAAQTAGATDVRRGGHHRTGRFAGHENREFEGGTAAQPGAFGRDHEQPAVAEVDPGPIGGLLIALAARALGEQGDRGGRGWLGDDGDVSRREPDLQVDRPVGGEFPGSHGLVPSYRDALLGQARQLRAKPVIRWPGPRRDGGGVEPAELSTARLTARISQVLTDTLSRDAAVSVRALSVSGRRSVTRAVPESSSPRRLNDAADENGRQPPVSSSTVRPRNEASSTSAICATAGTAAPAGSPSAEAICRLQPGLAEMTRDAPVSRMAAAFRSPSSPAASGCSRLYTPAEPQHVPPSETSASSSPGMARSSSLGWRRMPCACPRWHAS